jgi:hypothetical protein
MLQIFFSEQISKGFLNNSIQYEVFRTKFFMLKISVQRSTKTKLLRQSFSKESLNTRTLIHFSDLGPLQCDISMYVVHSVHTYVGIQSSPEICFRTKKFSTVETCCPDSGRSTGQDGQHSPSKISGVVQFVFGQRMGSHSTAPLRKNPFCSTNT